MSKMWKIGHRYSFRIGEECEVILIQIRIKKHNGSISTCKTSIFKDPNVAKHLSHLHDKNVVVPADKAPYNIVFVCKSYITSTDKDLGIDNSLGDPTYTPTTLTKEEILDNHRSVLCSFRMKNWLFLHSTWFLNYTRIFSNSVVFLGLPNTPQPLFPNH